MVYIHFERSGVCKWGWDLSRRALFAAPTPAFPHGRGSSSGYVSGIVGCSSGATPSPSLPRAPRKMQTHFTWEPARCELRPAGEGALVYIHMECSGVCKWGWGLSRRALFAAPTPALPHGGGSSSARLWAVVDVGMFDYVAGLMRWCMVLSGLCFGHRRVFLWRYPFSRSGGGLGRR